jgi:hypothetical protein
MRNHESLAPVTTPGGRRSGQQLHSCDNPPGCEIHPAKVAPACRPSSIPQNVSIQNHAFPRSIPHRTRRGMMVRRGPLSGDGPHLLGDLLIGQTHGQIRAFDAFTATPTLSILTSRAGNEAACGHHSGGAVASRIPDTRLTRTRCRSCT